MNHTLLNINRKFTSMICLFLDSFLRAVITQQTTTRQTTRLNELDHNQVLDWSTLQLDAI